MSEARLNGLASGALLIPDTEIEWYDFGGGFLVAPGLPGTYEESGQMAALCCTREGRFYYKIIEGLFTNADLPELFEQYAPTFAAEVKKTQETQ